MMDDKRGTDGNTQDSRDVKILRWALDETKKHPLAASMGVLVLLIFLVALAGRSDNEKFIKLLITLTSLSGVLYFSFFPSPSAKKFILGICIFLFISSLCMDVPIKMGQWLNQYFEISQKTAALIKASAIPAEPSSPPHQNPIPNFPIIPFNINGASINVSCEQSITTNVEFILPANSVLEGGASATWINVHNASTTQQVVQDGRTIRATGVIKGQTKQYILGIENCPGGGNGTLVLTGGYKLSGT